MQNIQKIRPVVAAAAGVVFLFCLLDHAGAEEKQWTKGGDGVSWEDDENWTSAGAPNVNDEVRIEAKDSEVVSASTINAQSIKIGGRGAVEYSTQDFVSGQVVPQEETDNALHIKKDATVTLVGDGTIILKGALRNTEESLIAEPAFMFTAQ